MLILGLTGSIGMGKTTAADDFRRLGVPVHDADAVVHDLMSFGGDAVEAVGSVFPGVEEDGAINRVSLGQEVFGQPDRLRKLEKILHPMVSERRSQFFKMASRRRARVVVLDVPLLFETNNQIVCDAVVTVTAPQYVQLHRVMTRPGMNRERFDQILVHQMSDAEKRRLSDFVVTTGQGRRHSRREIRKILARISLWTPKHWPPWAVRRSGWNKKLLNTKIYKGRT